jgi:hypothetical protein
MWYSGVVWRIRFESNREDIVAIVSRDVQMLGTGLVMLKM